MMNVLDEALKIKDYVVQMRRHFHKHPELGLKEFETAKVIENELLNMGIESERIGQTGILGVINGTSEKDIKHRTQKNILLRADIDALPIQEANDVCYKSVNDGVMHACGHDAHTAGLLGAARILNENKNEFYGKVFLFFQAAEEIGNGVKPLIASGKLKNVDRSFAMHVSSSLESGKIGIISGESNASCDYVKISVKGKTSHASKPQLGIDSVYIASLIIVQIQSIVSRLIDPINSAVISFGKLEAGNAYNIIADSATIEGSVRAFNNEVRSFITKSIEKIAKGIGEIYGAEVAVEILDYSMPVVNDEKLALEAVECAKKVFGKENVSTNLKKAFFADNFADISFYAPGIYALIGTQKDESTSFSLHNEHFDIDENALVKQTAMHVQYALDFLTK